MAYAKVEGGAVIGAWMYPEGQAPDGLIQCPDNVGPGWTYADGEFSPPAPTVIPIETKRANASLSRRDFCLAALGAGILNEADAIEAAKGGWPDSFAAAVPSGQETAAQIIWAAAATVDRMDPLLLAVATNMSVTDAQLDAMFGIGG